MNSANEEPTRPVCGNQCPYTAQDCGTCSVYLKYNGLWRDFNNITIINYPVIKIENTTKYVEVAK